MTQWFALRLRSNYEFKVLAALTGQGIEVFLPTWSETLSWSDRQKVMVRCLFPGYIFVRLGEGRDFYAACATRGVIQILPSSHKPQPVDDDDIENVRRVVASKLHAAPCEYVAGELVTIDSGPLAGLSGVVQRTKGSFTVVVSVEILHRSVRVELPSDTLVRVQLDTVAA